VREKNGAAIATGHTTVSGRRETNGRCERAKRGRGFIALARAEGEVTFAPPVAGAPQHMLGPAMMRAAGLNVTVVTYRASTLAMPDVIAGGSIPA